MRWACEKSRTPPEAQRADVGSFIGPDSGRPTGALSAAQYFAGRNLFPDGFADQPRRPPSALVDIAGATAWHGVGYRGSALGASD